jgi:hypothetical protein
MVKLGLIKTLNKFLGLKREIIYLIIGLALLMALLALGFSLFNKPILENVENINKKLELTFMKSLTENSANVAFTSLYNNIKTNYSSNPNIIFEEKMCSGSTLDDFLKTCTEGNLNYEKFLQTKVPTWNTNCPALILTLRDSTMANTSSGRTYIDELGFETDKTVITLQTAKTIIDKAVTDYRLTPPTPLTPEPPPLPPLTPVVPFEPLAQAAQVAPATQVAPAAQVAQAAPAAPLAIVPGPPPQVPDPPISGPANTPNPVTGPPNQGNAVPAIQTSQSSSPYTTTTTTTTTTKNNQ